MKTITVVRTYTQSMTVEVSDEEYERVINRDPEAMERVERASMIDECEDTIADWEYIDTEFMDEDGDPIS